MAKRTRRERKLETEKRITGVVDVESPPQAAAVEPAIAAAPTPETNGARKIVDFSKEYYYVYADMRNVAVVAASMFVLMFVLGYFI